MPLVKVKKKVRPVTRPNGEESGDGSSSSMPDLPFSTHKPINTKHLTCIIYGDTGVGKTYLIASATQYEPTRPLLVIAADPGTLSMSDFDQEYVEVHSPENWKALQDVYRWLRNENTYFKSVAIDSATELQAKHSLGSIMGELNQDFEYTDLARAVAPTRQDYLKTGTQMPKVFRAFQNLAYLDDEDRRVHVFITTLERMDEKRNVVHPLMVGGLGIQAGSYVDVLARLSRQPVMEDGDDGEPVPTGEYRRFLLTDEYVDSEGVKYTAKNRGGRLGRGFWDPTIEKIVGVWQNA